MKSTKPFGESVLSQLVRKNQGCAFAATSDGRIMDANSEGWRLVQSWWRLEGRKELAEWLRSETHQEAIPTRIVNIGRRQYELYASKLPMQDAFTSQAIFSIVGEELLAGGNYPLAYVRKAYRLSRKDGELLNLLLMELSHAEIGVQLDLHPMKVKEMAKRLKQKLVRHRDGLVRFAFTQSSAWS